MHRSKLPTRLAPVLVLLAGCPNEGTPIDTDTDTDTESTTEQGTSTNPPDPTTTNPDETTTTTDPTTGSSSDTGPDDTGTTTDPSTTDPSTTDPSTTTDTTGTSTTDTTTDTTTEPNNCGNDAIDDPEVCDGAQLADQDCGTLGFDGGTLACLADCSDFDTTLCTVATCGNDAIEGAEVCDGTQLADQDCVSQGFVSGELACADGCAAFDTTNCVSCGDGTVNANDICDGTDLAGKTCVTEGFTAGELACAADCTLDTSLCTTCGDNAQTGAEICDGTDLAGEDCVSQGFLSGTLACAATCDGYDTSACSDVNLVDETEPNDDGTPSSGNDFDVNVTNGPYSVHTLVHAAIQVIGDDDVFAVTNTADVPVAVSFETFGPGGVGTCAAGTDTVIYLRNAQGALLKEDDEGSAFGNCSLIANYVFQPGQTLYIQVVDYLQNSTIASYYLDIKFTPITCGDGVAIAPVESCDDGNTNDGDGCSSACAVESTPEIEPNGNQAQADANGDFSTNALIAAAITPVADADVYRFTLAATTYLSFETFTSYNDCTAGDTVLELFDNAFAPIIGAPLDDAVDDKGIGLCSGLNFQLAAGTYYVRMTDYQSNDAIASYFLEMRPNADQGMETEPNDTRPTASLNLQTTNHHTYVFGDRAANDFDWYQIDVPIAGSSLRLEVIEGDRAVETCESNGINSNLTLYNAMGTQLVTDDNNGRGACSLIDGTGSNPVNAQAHNLAAGTYYARVGSPVNDANGQFTYRLVSVVRKP